MLQPGTRIGPYEVASAIGAGGMGEVYRARDPRLKRDVAIKVLPPSFASDRQRLQRFEQEAHATAALNHPNILAVYDIGQQDGAPYIVGELLEGETLRDKLHAGALPVRKAIDYVQQIARGLAGAHDKGIVHRDLKPENVFVTRDGRVKILDFGLAKLTERESPGNDGTATVLSDAGTVLGTVGYMAPEQARGKPADARSDLFSLGAILYELLTGQRAFKGDSAADTISAILHRDPPELSSTNGDVPPAVDRIMRHCLEKDPAERFQSARDVAFALEAISDRSVVAQKSIAEKPSRKWLLVAIAAGVIVLAAVLGFAAFRSARTEAPPFRQITFRSGSIQAARFGSDGLNVIYSAQWEGDPPQIQTSRVGDTEFRSLGLPTATIAAVSSQGALAILLGCEPFFVSDCGGTLAEVPPGGGAPRPLLEHVHYADWSPTGDSLAVVVQDPNGQDRLEYPIGHILYQSSGWITTPRISRDGKQVAFAYHDLANDDRGRVALVDTEGHVRFLTSELASIEGVAWSPSGREVWVAASAEVDKSAWADTLYSVGLNGRMRALQRFPAIVHLHDVASDGRILLSREIARKEMIGYFPGDHAEHPYSWLDWSLPGGLSNNGRYLLFTEAGAAATDSSVSYLRPTNDAPPVRLGKGAAVALSPDGKWAAVNYVIGNKLALIPTGAGNSREMESGNIAQYDFPGWWSGDGNTISFVAREPGHGLCVYSQPVNGGAPRRRSPELQFIGALRPHFAVSPDAALAALIPAGASKVHLFDSSGKDLGEAAGGTDEDVPATFSGDGRLIVGPRLGKWPLQFFALDLQKGTRTLWKTFGALDRSGLRGDWDLRATPDLNYYVYSITQVTSELYVMESPVATRP